MAAHLTFHSPHGAMAHATAVMAFSAGHAVHARPALVFATITGGRGSGHCRQAQGGQQAEGGMAQDRE
jgi:hypothetical protein